MCSIVFFFGPAFAFVVGVRPTPFENRALHAFPSPGDGWGFFTALPLWATDHLPLREAGVDAANGVSTGIFGDPPGTHGQTAGGAVFNDPRSQPERVPADLYPRVIIGKDGWLYFGEDVIARCFPVLDVDGVVGALNRLRTAVESSGRRFELVIAPDKTTMVPQYLPDDYVGRDCSRARATEFWRRIPPETGAIDLRDALRRAAAQPGAAVYDRIDSHWSFEGGLIMTHALVEQLAPDASASWAVAPREYRPWPADLPRLLGRSEERKLRAYSLAPDGAGDRTRYVASDFKKPLRLEQAQPPAKGTVTEPSALVSDSYTQFATPFLAASVPDLTIVHAETVGASSVAELAELFKDRDVVAFEFVERILSGGGSVLLREKTIDKLVTALARNPR